MKNQSRTLGWINWLIISIVFCDLITTAYTALPQSVQNAINRGGKSVNLIREYYDEKAAGFKKPRYAGGLLRMFFVTVRIQHMEQNKQLRFECAGTLIEENLVLTAASCFMARQKQKRSGKPISGSEILLEVKHVDVLVGEFSVHQIQTPIDAESVDIPNSNLQISVAKVKLVNEANLEWKKLQSPAGINRLLDVEPLALCNPINWKRERAKNRPIFIAGLACKNVLIRKEVVPMRWRELEMKFNDTKRNCKRLNQTKTKFNDAISYCATGTALEKSVRDKKFTYTDMNTFDSYERICEDLGGPVFMVGDRGVADCLVGIVIGLAPSSTLKNKVMSKFSLVNTKDDWYNGIEFTPVENFNRWAQTLERIYEKPKPTGK